MNSARPYGSLVFGVARHMLLSRRQAVSSSGLGRVDGFPHLRAVRGGRLILGARTRLLRNVRIELETSTAQIKIGARTFVNRDCEIICRSRIDIGADCAISWGVLIMDNDAHVLDGGTNWGPISIGDRVWIGQGAKILKGVTIGAGAVIATGSIVTRDVPAGALVAGIPARIVRENVSWSL